MARRSSVAPPSPLWTQTWDNIGLRVCVRLGQRTPGDINATPATLSLEYQRH